MSSFINDTFIVGHCMTDQLETQKLIDRIKIIANLQSDKDVATLLGLTPADFSNRKKRGTLVPLIVEWALNVDGDLNGLFKGVKAEYGGNHEETDDNPCLRFVHTMTGCKGYQNWISDQPIDKILLSDELCKEMILVKMTGSSMEPTVNDGAIIAVDPGVKGFSSGQIFVVWIPIDGPIVRRVFVDLEKLVLRADNHAYPDITIPISEIPIENFILGRVTWVLQKL